MSDTSARTDLLLDGLAPGQRHWFWFCADGHPALVVSQMEGDSNGAEFQAVVAGARFGLPKDAQEVSGVVLGRSRTGVLLCPLVPSSWLVGQLATWVQSEIGRRPSLVALVGVAVVDPRNEDDIIQTDAGLWVGVIQPSVQGLADALEDLSPGESAWYWLGSGLPEGTVPLAMVPVRLDGSGRRFRARRRYFQVPDGAQGSVGIATVGADGALGFTSRDASASDCSTLSDWVDAHMKEHPVLARLHGAVFLRVSPGGEVAERYTEAREA